MARPVIDEEKCEGCGECVDTCPAECLDMKDGKAVVVDEDECLECESCVEVCEPGAITLEE